MPIALTIRGSHLPGRRCVTPGGTYENVHVGVQVKKDVVELVAGDAKSATWALALEHVSGKDGHDWKGPAVQGKKGDRFLYLSWGSVNDAGAYAMFRRAKLMLEAIDNSTLASARKAGALVAEVGLSMPDGTPLCAAVRPPRIKWRAG